MAANLTAIPPGIPLDWLETQAAPLGTWEYDNNGPYPLSYSNGVGESQPQFTDSSPSATSDTAVFGPSDPQDFMFESQAQ